MTERKFHGQPEIQINIYPGLKESYFSKIRSSNSPPSHNLKRKKIENNICKILMG